jgi:hypothetical protein
MTEPYHCTCKKPPVSYGGVLANPFVEFKRELFALIEAWLCGDKGCRIHGVADRVRRD